MLKHDYHLLRVVVSYKSQPPWPFQFWAQDPPETMGKGSGIKMPLLVAGIFSKLRGSAGHSVPHCCGKQSQGCNQKSSGCDVLGSSKTKGCKASCRSTMSGCKFNKVTSTSRVFEMSTASKIQDTHGVHAINICVIYWVYICLYCISLYRSHVESPELTSPDLRQVTCCLCKTQWHFFFRLTDLSTCWDFMPEHWPLWDKSLIWQTSCSKSNNIFTLTYQLYYISIHIYIYIQALNLILTQKDCPFCVKPCIGYEICAKLKSKSHWPRPRHVNTKQTTRQSCCPHHPQHIQIEYDWIRKRIFSTTQETPTPNSAAIQNNVPAAAAVQQQAATHLPTRIEQVTVHHHASTWRKERNPIQEYCVHAGKNLCKINAT